MEASNLDQTIGAPIDQSASTPPPEYLMLTPALNNYGGGSLNAVDLLQIHQTDFEASLRATGSGLITRLNLQETTSASLSQDGLMVDQFYTTLVDGGQLLTRNDSRDFNYEQFSPSENRVDSPSSQKSDHSSKSEVQDPFSPNCKIPLPTPFGPYEYWLEPSFIRRRNERERQRVRNVNEGFERLRNHLPLEGKEKDKRLSKVETLRYAIDYIHDLRDILQEADEREQRQLQNHVINSDRNNYQCLN